MRHHTSPFQDRLHPQFAKKPQQASPPCPPHPAGTDLPITHRLARQQHPWKPPRLGHPSPGPSQVSYDLHLGHREGLTGLGIIRRTKNVFPVLSLRVVGSTGLGTPLYPSRGLTADRARAICSDTILFSLTHLYALLPGAIPQTPEATCPGGVCDPGAPLEGGP